MKLKASPSVLPHALHLISLQNPGLLGSLGSGREPTRLISPVPLSFPPCVVVFAASTFPTKPAGVLRLGVVFFHHCIPFTLPDIPWYVSHSSQMKSILLLSPRRSALGNRSTGIVMPLGRGLWIRTGLRMKALFSPL